MNKFFIIISSIIYILTAIINVFVIFNAKFEFINPITEIGKLADELGPGALIINVIFPVLLIQYSLNNIFMIIIFLYLTLGFFLLMLLKLIKKYKVEYYVIFVVLLLLSIKEIFWLIENENNIINICALILLILFMIISISELIYKLYKKGKCLK